MSRLEEQTVFRTARIIVAIVEQISATRFHCESL